MEKLELLLHEYKVCHDGYIARDGLVPVEFSHMVRTYLILVGFLTAFKLVIKTDIELGTILFTLTSAIGLLCLFSYSINIECKASSKGAIRHRMSEIEKIFEEAELPLRYWYSVVNRETSGIERFIKRKSSSDSREEKGSASIWFVRAAYLIVLSWVLLVFFLYIGHVELATFK